MINTDENCGGCNFSCLNDRRGSGSLKWDYWKERGRSESLIPMWVADTDFKTCSRITKDIIDTANHAIYGYSEPKDDYFSVLQKWHYDRYGLTVEKDYWVQTPGLVFALAHFVRALTQENDAVLICNPVYYPFSEVVVENNRKLVVAPLNYDKKSGEYSLDYAAIEAKIKENAVKLWFFCSPHNPVGRVWTKEELKKVGEIAKKHGVFIVSDEIHCDIVYSERKHTVFWCADESFADFSAVMTSRGKSFNIAGLQIGEVFIKDKAVREKFKQEIVKSGYSQRNIFGLIGTRAAYLAGADYLDELVPYLQKTRDYLTAFIKSELPKFKASPVQGTYLSWVNMSAVTDNHTELKAFVEDKAGLWLDSGTMFGKSGAGFERINFAAP
ncbi:MAG: PatB family C-S lyase, partial [Christensenellaceae bacterium]|nr:PatB family C-S lyase [Christensenellaceae bacterium]